MFCFNTSMSYFNETYPSLCPCHLRLGTWTPYVPVGRVTKNLCSQGKGWRYVYINFGTFIVYSLTEHPYVEKNVKAFLHSQGN